MRKRALLSCALLVMIVMTACGCTVNWIPIPDDEEKGQVNTVVHAFMTALRNQDSGAMEGWLASYVTSMNDVAWINVLEGGLPRAAFASTWTGLLQNSDLDISALQFVQGPSTTVYGGQAVSTGRILLTLNHPESWFDDWTTRLVIEDTYPVEDIYPVGLELQRVGLGWKVSYFRIYEGERQSAFADAWTTFAQGFFSEDAEAMLSVCANPFYWTGIPEFDGISTHYEWRLMLAALFDDVTTQQMNLIRATPIQLDSRSGAFRVEIQSGLQSFEAEVTMIYDGYEWFLSGVHFPST